MGLGARRNRVPRIISGPKGGPIGGFFLLGRGPTQATAAALASRELILNCLLALSPPRCVEASARGLAWHAGHGDAAPWRQAPARPSASRSRWRSHASQKIFYWVCKMLLILRRRYDNYGNYQAKDRSRLRKPNVKTRTKGRDEKSIQQSSAVDCFRQIRPLWPGRRHLGDHRRHCFGRRREVPCGRGRLCSYIIFGTCHLSHGADCLRHAPRFACEAGDQTEFVG